MVQDGFMDLGRRMVAVDAQRSGRGSDTTDKAGSYRYRVS